MIDKNIKNQIIVYQSKTGAIELKGDFNNETIWASLDEIAYVFERDKSVISRHIKNIFKDGELNRNSVVAFFATTTRDGKIYKVEYFNLDVILSVGYRVNSKKATLFRKWATKTLKQHIIKGYTINEKRLLETQEKFKELQTAISFLQDKSQKEMLTGQSQEILNLLSSYAKTLTPSFFFRWQQTYRLVFVRVFFG